MIKNRKLKNQIVRLFGYCLLFIAFSAITISCSKDNDKEAPIETESIKDIFVRRIQAQIDELTVLLNQSIFGDMKGNYPKGSKILLTERIAYLEEALEKLNNGTKNLTRSDMDNIISETMSLKTRYLATVLTKDFEPLPAELYVEGKSGGYIDFGSSPNYSTFDNGFTVELWLKFTSLGNFDYILSTFIDNYRDPDRFRYGWAVNYYGEGGASSLRMTYVLGQAGLYEPGVNFNNIGNWVHVAFVWNPAKFSDIDSNDPNTFKMYINGELVKSEHWNETNYTPNTTTSMIGFNFTNFDGTIAAASRGSNGRMKHMHIWNAVKSQADIQKIMNAPESVLGSESDLVCGWRFDRTVSDDTNIVDITGRYSAKLVGTYNWIK